MAEQPAVSVIIPVYQNEADLRRCLVALAQQDYDGEVSIIVVDNAPQASLAPLQFDSLAVTCVHEPQVGSYAARNAGIAAANTSLLVFTDADCIPCRTWLREGVATLLHTKNIGLVGGGVVVTAQGAPPSAAEFIDIATGFTQQHYIENVHYAATANMFTRAEVFDTVGTFDATLRSGGDVQWGARVHAAGYVLAYAPKAQVEHPARKWKELLAKKKRIACGARDAQPTWGGSLIYVLHALTPSRRRISRLWVYPYPRRLWATRLLATALLLVIDYYGAAIRLKLQLVGGESAR